MARKQKGSMSTRDPRDVVTAWAEDVVAGRIVSGAFERELAAQHLSDLKTGHKRGIVWDLEAALLSVDQRRRKADEDALLDV